MVKERTTTPHEQLNTPLTSQTPVTQHDNADTFASAPSSNLHQPLKRYTTLALTLAVVPAGLLMLGGYASLGKGLILGALFSVINFILMAVALPLRLGRGRGPSTLVSLGSIAVRYALLAAPLVVAVNHSQFAILSTAVGLFMVQLAIMLDRAWIGRRLLVEAKD